jgi:hypothetical protein
MAAESRKYQFRLVTKVSAPLHSVYESAISFWDEVALQTRVACQVTSLRSEQFKRNCGPKYNCRLASRNFKQLPV